MAAVRVRDFVSLGVDDAQRGVVFPFHVFVLKANAARFSVRITPLCVLGCALAKAKYTSASVSAPCPL